MLRLKQVSYQEEKREWIISAWGHEVPVSVIANLFRPLFILAILYVAYVVGQTDVLVRNCNAKIQEANAEILKCKQGGYESIMPGLNLTKYNPND